MQPHHSHERSYPVRILQRAFMSTLAYSFLHKSLFGDQATVARLRAAGAATGTPSYAARGLPRWVAPTLAAVALAAAVARERR